MYSAVLMIALTTVGGHKNSCYASCHSSCYTGVAACSSACSGSHVAYHGCSGSCHVSSCHSSCYSSCHSSCHKKHGGLFKKLFSKKRCHGCHSCFSSCHTSYYACSGSACSSSCGGEVIIEQAAPVEEAPKKIEAKEAPKAEGAASTGNSSAVTTVSYKVSEATYVSRPVIVYYSR